MDITDGDYVLFVSGSLYRTDLEGSIGKAVHLVDGMARVRILKSSYSRLDKGERIFTNIKHLQRLDPHVGQILDD